MSTEDQPGTSPPSIEDRVRTATRAGASLIREVSPLTAPGPGEAGPLRHRLAPVPHRWPAWAVPLVAAAAVVAVALSLVAVRQFRPAAPPAPAVTAPAAVPRYYAVLNYDAKGDIYTGPLIVGDDLTGKVIATIAPPPGLIFNTVQGAPDDRTFVIMAGSKAARGSAPFTWYLLRIFPGTAHPYQLTKLPIKSPQGLVYALSPDGQELAVESLNDDSAASPTTLALYSVSSGTQLQAWTAPANILSGLGGGTLSWLPGGRQLVFSVGRFTTGQDYTQQLRELDVTGSGTDLLAASQALLTINNSGPSTCVSPRIAPDGETVVCATQYAFLSGNGSNAGCANGGLRFTAYSVRTGQPVRVLYAYRGACHNGLSFVLWTDPSATQVIGAIETDVANEGGKQAGQLGVITSGHLRPLKLPRSIPPADYGSVAF